MCHGLHRRHGLEEVYELIQKCEHKLVVVVDSNAHRVPIGVAASTRIVNRSSPRPKSATLSAGSIMDARIRKVSDDQSLESIDAQSSMS
jgi:hypothetical protein